MRFAIFPLHLSKVLRPPRKSDARSCEVLHPSRKIISANLKIWCSKMQPLSGNQRPDLLTSLMMILRPPQKPHLCRSSSHVPRLPSFLEMLQNTLFAHFWQGAQSRLPRETTSKRQKVVRACSVFNMFTSKCASRHNSVHFFDISTSKSAPNMMWQLRKVLRTCCFFSFFTCKCASRHNGVNFFDIATSKSAPNVKCF